MAEEESKVKVLDTTGNPGPLGLMGFGMTTVLLNLHNSGVFALGSIILSMGIFYGGLAQIFAGIMEWKKGNTFGTTAFTSYGLFWLSLVGFIMLPMLGLGNAPELGSDVAYLTLWGIFTTFMFFGTLKANRAIQFVFASLALLFFMLAIGDYLASEEVIKVAGIEGIICGSSAIYTAMAEVLNEANGKTVLPLWPVKN